MNSRLFRRAVTPWLLVACLFQAGVAGAANVKPTANAGVDQVAGKGVEVTLNGGASSDSDGTIRKFRWTQSRGPKVALIGPTSAAPTFVSPAKLRGKLSSARLVFTLTVIDDKRAKAKDTVAVTVAETPVCPERQVLSKGVCVDPPVCVSPRVLQGAVCVTPLPLCVEPEVLRGGVCVDPRPVCQAPQVLQNGVCADPQPQCSEPEVLVNGLCATLSAPIAINDTGFLSCSDSIVSGVACPLSLYPGQDAEFGRDRLAPDDGDGLAGFSFTKISQEGADLPADASTWDCVRDNVTGLVWEVKGAKGGLRDKDLRYSNFSASHDPEGTYGTAGDAAGFVQAVNQQGLCGASDWRLPSADELQGIVDYGVAYPGPTVEPRFFPDGVSSPYWSGTPNAKSDGTAWVVYFNDGRVFDDHRSVRYPVRLVRVPTGDDAAGVQ